MRTHASRRDGGTLAARPRLAHRAGVPGVDVHRFSFVQSPGDRTRGAMMAGNSTPCATSVWFLVGEAQETGSTRKIHVNSTPFQVGRRLDLTLPLPCLTVSKLHAELFLERDLLWVRDLQSMNGTYVNGRRIQGETLLDDG